MNIDVYIRTNHVIEFIPLTFTFTSETEFINKVDNTLNEVFDNG